MAADRQKLSFYEYLSLKAADPSVDPAGDFALDAEADSFFPRSIYADDVGFRTAFNYIYYHKHAHWSVVMALMECWSEYYKAATGADWIEPGYDARDNTHYAIYPSDEVRYR